ncbi:MAG: TatD family hydrolase [Bdellovibrionales bacterium]|nr:TatD family hydrolase [Bdellovibrionales bacterium]
MNFFARPWRIGTPNVAADLDLIDGHCHVSDPRLAPTESHWLTECAGVGIRQFILGGVDPEDWDRQIAFRQRVAPLGFKAHLTFGLHPWFVASHSDEECERAFADLKNRILFRAEARDHGIVGIGEMGLDSLKGEMALQKKWFQKQWQFAQEVGMPVVLHVVRAHSEACEILGMPRGLPGGSGIVHSFSEGPEIAMEYINRGFLLSISGVIARKGFQKLKRAVVQVNPKDLCFESDAPDQPPPRLNLGTTRPGETGPSFALNLPTAIRDVAETIQVLRKDLSINQGWNTEKWLGESRENLIRCFDLYGNG